jgi:hypothetical protein
LLRQGFSDFEAYRSDVIFRCATYAIVGVVLARAAGEGPAGLVAPTFMGVMPIAVRSRPAGKNPRASKGWLL